MSMIISVFVLLLCLQACHVVAKNFLRSILTFLLENMSISNSLTTLVAPLSKDVMKWALEAQT